MRFFMMTYLSTNRWSKLDRRLWWLLSAKNTAFIMFRDILPPEGQTGTKILSIVFGVLTFFFGILDFGIFSRNFRIFSGFLGCFSSKCKRFFDLFAPRSLHTQTLRNVCIIITQLSSLTDVIVTVKKFIKVNKSCDLFLHVVFPNSLPIHLWFLIYFKKYIFFEFKALLGN